MSEAYVYILPFKCGKYFKIGYSKSENYERFDSLSENYSIDFDNSYVVHGSKISISKLEKELLSKTSVSDWKFRNDGYTEVRSIKDLNFCLDYARNKENVFLERFNRNKKIISNCSRYVAVLINGHFELKKITEGYKESEFDIQNNINYISKVFIDMKASDVILNLTNVYKKDNFVYDFSRINTRLSKNDFKAHLNLGFSTVLLENKADFINGKVCCSFLGIRNCLELNKWFIDVYKKGVEKRIEESKKYFNEHLMNMKKDDDDFIDKFNAKTH